MKADECRRCRLVQDGRASRLRLVHLIGMAYRTCNRPVRKVERSSAYPSMTRNG